MLNPKVLPGLILLFYSLVTQAQTYINPLVIPPLMTGQQFQLDIDTGSVPLLPGFRTLTYGFNGAYLGPTLELTKGDQVSITINNHLTEESSVHWHGLHVPAAMDGGPETIIPAGGTFVSSFDVMNPAATFWYHPHVHMNTEAQVEKGLAGFIIIRDSSEATLNLPRDYGTDDFPIVLQDRSYSGSNQFIIGGLADSMLVNGVIRPHLDVQSKVIRFRLLNGSSARVYNLGFSDNRNFHVIAGDASLLPEPFSTNRFILSNGERVEILVDFSGSVGDTIFLMSYASELPTSVPGNMPGMMGNNGPLDGADFNILQIGVIPPLPGGVTAIPLALVPVSTWDSSTVNKVRNRTITGQGMASMGNFYLDGLQYIMGFVNDTMKLGDIELWNISNFSNISHPMHVHDVSFRILARNGMTPPGYESGWKDVFNILPQETVTIIMRFQDFADATVPYMYHCHNLAHEDMGMMTSFIVIDTATSGTSSHQHSPPSYLFPNPSTSYWDVMMEVGHDEEYELTVSDLAGRVLKIISGRKSHHPIRMETADLPSGCYVVEMKLPQNGDRKVMRGIVAHD